ncbi:MAG: glycosyltransferase family 2 protein [Acidobacteriia bacterium]|nr:glycosyltransferase family 2 protein [Terriglobia bacterium]
MASSNKIGIVTVTYNSGKVLQDFLHCVFAQNHSNLVLFVIDNASADSTLQLLRDCVDPRLVIIANPDNRGVAEGNNQGIRAALEARCDSVLLINNDTVFDNDLVEKLSAGLSRHAADMTCPKMMYFDEPRRFWAAGGSFQPWFGYRIFQRGEVLDCGQYDQVEQVSYVPTCCVLIQAALFGRTGLMDAKYFVYMDDVDFMFRAHRVGAKLMYLPECKLLHKVSSLAGGKHSTVEIRYCTRNRVYFLIKSFGFLKALPWLLLYEAYLCARLVVLRDNIGMFKFKQQAFFNGLSMGH